MKRKIELLAPAGNPEKLKVAVLYGADAVYLGGKELSLRNASENFSFREIEEGVEFAHFHGAKVYVALNAYPEDRDRETIDGTLKRLDEIGVDAIIVSSLYILRRAAELHCRFGLHVSTQESVTNRYGIGFFRDYSVSRVILAREMSLEQIRRIKENVDVDLEVFIHGAMCCSYSGRCTLSDFFTGRKANRGDCAHPCRWKYALYREEEETGTLMMGSKDLMALRRLPALIDAGIASLKIEGRMKSLSYLAHTVKAYRTYLDDIYNETVGKKGKYLAMMENAVNRETTEGWLKGECTEDDLIGESSSTPVQNYLGLILDYDFVSKTALIALKNPFSVGKEIEVFSYDTENRSFVVEEILDPENRAVPIADNTFFRYRIKVPFPVKSFEMLMKKAVR